MNLERSPDAREAITLYADGDLELSAITSGAPDDSTARDALGDATTRAFALAELPPGARLVLRCRKDWRAASVSSVEEDCVRLNVASPSGHTYRVRRPHDSPLTFDGPIPVLGARESEPRADAERAAWRVALARYDVRW